MSLETEKIIISFKKKHYLSEEGLLDLDGKKSR